MNDGWQHQQFQQRDQAHFFIFHTEEIRLLTEYRAIMASGKHAAVFMESASSAGCGFRQRTAADQADWNIGERRPSGVLGENFGHKPSAVRPGKNIEYGHVGGGIENTTSLNTLRTRILMNPQLEHMAEKRSIPQSGF